MINVKKNIDEYFNAFTYVMVRFKHIHVDLRLIKLPFNRRYVCITIRTDQIEATSLPAKHFAFIFHVAVSLSGVSLTHLSHL